MNKKELFTHLLFFDDLDDAEMEELMSHVREKTFKKGTTIFLEGQPGDELYIVKSGTVKIYRTDGVREMILALLREGHFFGEMALLQRGELRSANAEAIEPAVLNVLKRLDFERMLEKNHKLTLKLLFNAMDRLRKANEHIEYLTFLDVRSRVYRILLRLSEDYGIPSEEGTLIDFKLTHQQLADMIGTVRESVTKVLLELQDEKLITYEHRKIVLKQIEPLKAKLQSRI